MKAKFYIDVERLEKADACRTGIARFRKVFGSKKVPVTRANLERAAKAGVDVMWLFNELDSDAEEAAFARIDVCNDNYMEDPSYLDALWEVIKAKEGTL